MTIRMSILPTPERLVITAQQWHEMRDDADQKTPEEACGLLAGTIDGKSYTTMRVIPTVNILHSPLGYQLDPHEQLAAFLQIEEQGWELIGVYHSHPKGPEEPSPTDIAEAYYPEAVYLIWCGLTGDWTCRGFLIREGNVQEIQLVVREGD
jgi:proteasome lid subunit RPN8/RPN11